MYQVRPSIMIGLACALLATAITAVGVNDANAGALQVEPAVQILYVVPQGQQPDPAVPALIPPAIDAIQVFLRQDIGRTLRVRPNIITQSVTNGPARDMRDQLISAGFADLNTIYLVFAESAAAGLCGTTTYGGLSEPNFSWVFMQSCDAPRDPGPQEFPFGVTYLALHELLHALGAVPSCAPNEDGGSHVNDSPFDMLYHGTEEREWFSLAIDVGNDDYYGHTRTDCPDIKGSVFWDNTLPPGELCDGRTVTIDMRSNGGIGTGTTGPDVIRGTAGDDMIDALSGNDIVCAGGGNDTIVGGSGNDLIFAAGGDDVVTGGDGNDTIFGEAGHDILRGNADRDQLDGGAGRDRLLGGVGNDDLRGRDGADYLGGFGGDDFIDGGNGDDVIYGGFGADRIFAGAGDDRVHGLIGDDTITGGVGNDVLDGDRGNDNLNGGPGNDIIRGGNATDALAGDAGDDELHGGKADDSLDGGAGIDLCVGNAHTVSDAATSECETTFGIP